MLAQIPHEQSRFLASVGLGTDMAAVELMRTLSAEERAEVGQKFAAIRDWTNGLREKVAERKRKEAAEATQEEG